MRGPWLGYCRGQCWLLLWEDGICCPDRPGLRRFGRWAGELLLGGRCLWCGRAWWGRVRAAVPSAALWLAILMAQNAWLCGVLSFVTWSWGIRIGLPAAVDWVCLPLVVLGGGE